jgi:hypothetical protein
MADTLTEIVARRAPSEFQSFLAEPMAETTSADFLFEPAPAPRGAQAEPTPQRKVRPVPPVQRTSASASVSASAPARRARSSRTVRVPELVVGLLLVAGCALAALLLQRSDSAGTTVVVAARPVARGSVITAADLTGSVLVGDTSMLISGTDAQLLLGQVAAVDISLGMPLNNSMLTTAGALGPDEALTSVALQAGRLPPDLTPNDVVRVVVVTTNGAVTEARLLEPTALVWSLVGPEGSSSDTIVTLRGPLSLATDLAGASTVQISRVEGE